MKRSRATFRVWVLPQLAPFCAVAFAAAISGPAAAQERMRFDTPTQVSDIEIVCTGIGSESREDPRWAGYPLKVEVAGEGGQFLGDVGIDIAQDGVSIAEFTCGGPWILAGLQEGTYTVNAVYEDQATSGVVNVPAGGQAQLILRFPEEGGARSPEHTPATE